MSFTYNIQKVDFFTDQVEEMGQIDLDGAIVAFQKFPFADQLKEANQREMTSCLPTISFKSQDKKILGIWVQDDKGFFLFYDNGKQTSEFFLSNDFNQNPEGLIVEEFIEQFFNEIIEQSIQLQDKSNSDDPSDESQKQSSSIITFSFKDTNKFKPAFGTILYFVLALAIFRIDMVRGFKVGWGIHFFLGFLWFPGVILHISYWIKNYSAKVNIFINEKRIEYEKNGQVIKFNRNEISTCELNKGSRSYNNYSFLRIILIDKRMIIITSFIVKPELIVEKLNLNFTTKRRGIPFLII